ncbi:MAG: EVE domain-containing protein [Gammaproteobacteria bacterium]
MSHIWLMKSEPEVFSIDDLQKNKVTSWEGVRNYQARNMLRDEIHQGDRVLFYHSNCATPGIAGLAEVIRSGYPDDTAFDPNSPYFDPKSDAPKPRWYRVDVKFIRKFPCIITLYELRATFGLESMWVLRKGNRLSITPISPQEYEIILQLVHP